MSTIVTNESEQIQDDKTAKSIARLVRRYKEREEVECMFFVPYVDENSNGSYYLVVVLSKLSMEIEEEFSAYNKAHAKPKAIESFGGEIKVLPDLACYYKDKAIGADHPSEEMIRVRELLDGSILYDKTGKYGELVEKIYKQFEVETPEKPKELIKE